MRGEVRSGTQQWLLFVGTCGIYAFYWWYVALGELRDAEANDREPLYDLLPLLVPCFGIFWAVYLHVRMGHLVRDAQHRAGVPDAENHALKFLLFQCLCGYGYAVMQEELNRVWLAPPPEGAASGAPVAVPGPAAEGSRVP